MKKYGLRIGKIGLEFVSIDERDKAIRDFTKGSDVEISDRGIKYSEGKGNFSVYDRDTKEIVTTCVICKGEFSIDSCSVRNYPFKYSYSKSFEEREDYICDACLAKQIEAKKLFDAQQIIEKSKGGDEE